MIITAERFQTLIEAYGTESARWPEDEREAASKFLRENVAAQQVFNEFEALDELLALNAIPSLALIEQRVLALTKTRVRESWLDVVLNCLLPRSERLMARIWRPALAACFPLIFGIYLSNFYTFGIDHGSNTIEEELLMLSLNDYAEIQE
jgi:hypothetical protein